MSTTVPAPTKNERLLAWVGEVASLTEPEKIVWCDGSAEEYDRLCERARRGGHVREADRGEAPELLPGAVGPGRRGARGGPDVHLLGDRGGSGADEQLARPAGDARAAERAVRRCMKGRTMYVVPFSMGPLGSDKSHIGVQLTDSTYVAVSMRIMTRMGQGALGHARLGGRVRALPALGRHAARRRRAGRAVAVQRGQQVHRPLPRHARDHLVRLGLRRQRAAREEVLRAANRLGDGARRGLDGRAHADPEADVSAGRGQVHHRCVPERVREDEPRDVDPDAGGLDGRDDRRRHRLDEVRRGRAAVRDQPRVRLLRRRAGHGRGDQPERDQDDRAELDLHELREDRRRRCLVGGHDQGASPRT